MKRSTWKHLSKISKFVNYHVNRRIGEKLQDIVDDLYEKTEVKK